MIVSRPCFLKLFGLACVLSIRMITSMSDIEYLLKHAATADPEISEALLSQYYDPVYRLACSILDDPAEADDAVQTSFIRAYRSLEKYQNNDNFRAWLFTIVINTCRDVLRRQKSRRRLKERIQAIFHLQDLPASPEDSVLQKERQQDLWSAVRQ